MTKPVELYRKTSELIGKFEAPHQLARPLVDMARIREQLCEDNAAVQPWQWLVWWDDIFGPGHFEICGVEFGDER